MARLIRLHRQGELFQIVATAHPSRGLTGCLDRRQQQSHKDSDNGDHDQEFHKRKRSAVARDAAGKGLGALHVRNYLASGERYGRAEDDAGGVSASEMHAASPVQQDTTQFNPRASSHAGVRQESGSSRSVRRESLPYRARLAMHWSATGSRSHHAGSWSPRRVPTGRQPQRLRHRGLGRLGPNDRPLIDRRDEIEQARYDAWAGDRRRSPVLGELLEDGGQPPAPLISVEKDDRRKFLDGFPSDIVGSNLQVGGRSFARGNANPAAATRPFRKFGIAASGIATYRLVATGNRRRYLLRDEGLRRTRRSDDVFGRRHTVRPRPDEFLAIGETTALPPASFRGAASAGAILAWEGRVGGDSFPLRERNPDQTREHKSEQQPTAGTSQRRPCQLSQ